jgi:hypothetical protein
LGYGAAIPAYNDKPEAAVAFVKFLSAPDKKDFWKTAGFELISTTYELIRLPAERSRIPCHARKLGPQSRVGDIVPKPLASPVQAPQAQRPRTQSAY